MREYKPLPSSLTVKESPIEGLGVFATKDIRKGMNLGVTHRIIDPGLFPKAGYLTVNFGGFYNHADLPNCFEREIRTKQRGLVGFELITVRGIKEGEEITVNYRESKLGN